MQPFDYSKYLKNNPLLKENIDKKINENSIEDVFNHEQRNIQLTLNLKNLSDSEFQEVYDSLNQNPNISRIRTYGNGFLEVDLIELNDENKATILKFKDKIKVN
jgi:predicted  nucleic acid-binding Zn-ribbon protein